MTLRTPSSTGRRPFPTAGPNHDDVAHEYGAGEESPKVATLIGSTAGIIQPIVIDAALEMPRWKERCEIKNTIKLGIVAITDAAKSGPHCVVCSPMKKFKAIGNVRCDGELIKVSAMTNSSQAKLKVNMATTANAGIDSGAMRRVSTRNVRAPSSRNDSSSSFGTASKNPRRRKIEKGRFSLA